MSRAVAAVKKLIPMFDRVLILKAEVLTKTEGGIMLPEKSQKKVLHGTVIAVGPGNRNQKVNAGQEADTPASFIVAHLLAKLGKPFTDGGLIKDCIIAAALEMCQNGELIPVQVSVGDKVLLPEYGGTRVEIEDNKEYHLFRESDILAKLEM